MERPPVIPESLIEALAMGYLIMAPDPEGYFARKLAGPGVWEYGIIKVKGN